MHHIEIDASDSPKQLQPLNQKGQPQKVDPAKSRVIIELVRRRGLEPLCLAALAPQASASANFATSAWA